MPYSTSRYACSLVSAMWHKPTSRHLLRSAVLPCAFASAVSTSQCSASASKPAAVVARSDSNVEERIGVRPQMQPRLAQVPAIVLERDRFVAGQKLGDDGNAIFEQR